MKLMDRLILFAKAPELGKIKTRLARQIGDQKALEAYTQLLRHLTHQLRRRTDVEVRITPDLALDSLKGLIPQGWKVSPQGEGDLGTRLTHAFQEAFTEGCTKVAAIGSDCPYITSHDIDTAWQSLAQKDVCVGPATDGGYWLIGLRAMQPQIFNDIPWSTQEVLAQTLLKCRQNSLSISLLNILSDVDERADWEEFLKSL